MRTTLTLDDDVAGKLEAEVRRSGRTYRAVVNDTLRLGLLASRKPAGPSSFSVRASALRLRPGMSYDNVEELLEEIEGPLRR